MSALRPRRVRKPVTFGPEFESQTRRAIAPALDATAAAGAKRAAVALVASEVGKINVVHKFWTSAEDKLLTQGVEVHGEKRWTCVADHVGGRTPKQCRERWWNHLNPNVDKGPWTPAEDLVLHKGVFELGHKWASIAQLLTNRTDNQVKNRYNAFLSSNHAAATAFSTNASSTAPALELSALEDANLLLELQRRNALTDVPRKRNRVTEANEVTGHTNKLHYAPWLFDEDLRLATGVQMELQRLGLEPESVNDANLREYSWGRIAAFVRDRSAGACHYRWRTLKRTCVFSDAMRHAVAPVVTEKPNPSAVEEFSFDDVLSVCANNSRQEDALLCFEEYDEGADTAPVVKAAYAVEIQPFFKRTCGTLDIAHRFLFTSPPPTRPRRTSNTSAPQNAPSAKRSRSKTGCKGTQSMKGYYSEAKRRAEAEAEAEAWEKIVFA
ncbi:MAG: hypothetical protein CMI29_08505 [Opitutae bacterium]|nr:hypothetical protein [Opitutae bacterium]|tara:strand:+ start:3158 stop:4474 length:1317 start_codon:yes stop_codon:yes gene_type:complete